MTGKTTRTTSGTTVDALNDLRQRLAIVEQLLAARSRGSVSWGLVAAPAIVTVDQGSITNTIVDIAGAACSFTAITNRRYRCTAVAFFSTTVAGDQYELAVTNTAGTPLNGGRDRDDMPVVGRFYGARIAAAIDTPVAGPVTYKLRAVRGAGTGTLTINSTSIPTVLLVEDMGPIA